MQSKTYTGLVLLCISIGSIYIMPVKAKELLLQNATVLAFSSNKELILKKNESIFSYDLKKR